MKFKKLLAGLLVATMAFQVGCSNGSDSSASNGNEIVIGEIGPLTGDAANYGESTFRGVDLAIEQFGDINGKKVVIKQLDDKAEPAEAVSAYSRLIDKEKVVAIIGAVTSGSTTAVVETSKANNTPLLTPTATLDSITTLGTNIFRSCFKDSYQGEVMAKYATEDLGAKTAAIIYNNSSDYSQGLSEAFIRTFEAEGGTIVANEAYSESDVNFKVQLSKIQSSNPDVIFAPDYYAKINLLVRQIRELGIDTPILGSDGWDGVLELMADDTSLLNNTYISNSFSLDDQDESVQKFISDFEAKYGFKPDGFAASGYDSAMVLLTAIKNADDAGELNNDGILKQLAATEVEGCNGKIVFDENHDAKKGAVIIEYKDGIATLNSKVEVE